MIPDADPPAADVTPDAAPPAADVILDAAPLARRAARLRRRKVFFGVGLALGIGIGLALLVWPHPTRRLVSRIVDATGVRDPDPKVLAKITNRLPDGPATARIDAARRYVYEHSVHLIDAEHGEYALDPPQILERLVATAEDGAAPAHLSCGPRTFALVEVLQALGYPSRVVAVIGERDGALRSHTFAEVENPDTGRWEAQDPDMDLVYVDRGSGQRLTAEEMLFMDLGAVDARGSDQDGWRRLQDGYFEALLYDTTRDHERSRIVVNGQRTEPGFGDRVQARYGDAELQIRR